MPITNKDNAALEAIIAQSLNSPDTTTGVNPVPLQPAFARQDAAVANKGLAPPTPQNQPESVDQDVIGAALDQGLITQQQIDNLSFREQQQLAEQLLMNDVGPRNSPDTTTGVNPPQQRMLSDMRDQFGPEISGFTRMGAPRTNQQRSVNANAPSGANVSALSAMMQREGTDSGVVAPTVDVASRMGNLTNEQVQGFAGDIMGNSVPPAIMEAQAQGAETQMALLSQAAEAEGFDLETVDGIIITAIREGLVDPETLSQLSPEDLVKFASIMQADVADVGPRNVDPFSTGELIMDPNTARNTSDGMPMARELVTPKKGLAPPTRR